MTALAVPLDTLGATISAHIAKGDASIEKAEQHYKAAGIHLIEAKERVKQTPGLTWPRFLVQHCQIRRARADELIMIADGRTTLADLRIKKAESVRATRERKKEESPLRSGEFEPAGLAAPAEDHSKHERLFWNLVAYIDDTTRTGFLASLKDPTLQFDLLAELDILRAGNVALATERNRALADVERLKLEVNRLRSRSSILMRLADARRDMATARRDAKFQTIGEIAYGTIPDLEKQLSQLDDAPQDVPGDVVDLWVREARLFKADGDVAPVIDGDDFKPEVFLTKGALAA